MSLNFESVQASQTTFVSYCLPGDIDPMGDEFQPEDWGNKPFLFSLATSDNGLLIAGTKAELKALAERFLGYVNALPE